MIDGNAPAPFDPSASLRAGGLRVPEWAAGGKGKVHMASLYLGKGEDPGLDVSLRETDVIFSGEGDVAGRIVLGPARPRLSLVATSLPPARARTVVGAQEPESCKAGREQAKQAAAREEKR